MFTKTLIAATLSVLISSAEAQSRRDSRGPSVPPPVVSQMVTTQRGEKVSVPLAIHGTRAELLEYIIRTPPSYGKLSAVKNGQMNTATVIYTPSARSKAAEDRFSYAVRGSEGVSAPGVIVIRFTEPAVPMPRLAAPNEVEFPPVFPGQRSSAELEITNEGGGFLEGEVSVEDPWSVDGVKIFKIAPGRNALIKLVFTPSQPGVRNGEAIITGFQRKIVALRASAEQRLEAGPALVKLTAQPGSQTRTGALKITNRSEEEATVKMEAGERLLMDHSVRVPALSTLSVPVFADAAEGASFDETVKLTSKDWSSKVTVHVVAVGAILRFEAAELGITGKAGDAPATGTAILENSGGEPVTVRLDVERPFEIETKVVTAPARGRVEIPVIARSPSAGTFQSPLKATGEAGSAITLVKAEIAEPVPKRTEPRAPKPEPVKPAETPEGAPAPAEENSLLIPTETRDVPNALGRFAHGTGVDTAVIEWPASLGPTENLRIEQRVLSISDAEELQVAWSPLAAVSITPAGERMTAALRALTPGTLYTVRAITGKDADATVLFTVDFATSPKKPIFTIAKMRTPLLAITLCILLFAVWRSRRAPQK